MFKACFNLILHMTAELQVIGQYYVSKLWELQLVNASYRLILRFGYISKNLRHFVGNIPKRQISKRR